MLKTDHGIKVDSVRVIMGYQVRSTISDAQAETLTYDLFADPVIEVAKTELKDTRRLLKRTRGGDPDRIQARRHGQHRSGGIGRSDNAVSRAERS